MLIESALSFFMGLLPANPQVEQARPCLLEMTVYSDTISVSSSCGGMNGIESPENFVLTTPGVRLTQGEIENIFRTIRPTLKAHMERTAREDPWALNDALTEAIHRAIPKWRNLEILPNPMYAVCHPRPVEDAIQPRKPEECPVKIDVTETEVGIGTPCGGQYLELNNFNATIHGEPLMNDKKVLFFEAIQAVLLKILRQKEPFQTRWDLYDDLHKVIAKAISTPKPTAVLDNTYSSTTYSSGSDLENKTQKRPLFNEWLRGERPGYPMSPMPKIIESIESL